MIAVREVIANALVHRDYEPPDSCVHIRLFDDRLEVSSPGTWLGIHLEPEVEYNLASLQRQSLKRNFRLAHILSGIRLVEGDGSGIPSALRDCAESDAPAPVVKSDDHFVHVIFRPREPSAIRGIPVKSAYAPGDLEIVFRDRAAELETLSRGVGSIDGPHFWLVTAPPGLGKTWLLDRFRAVVEADPSWTIRLVDVSTIPDVVRDDPMALLSRMFGVPALPPPIRMSCVRSPEISAEAGKAIYAFWIAPSYSMTMSSERCECKSARDTASSMSHIPPTLAWPSWSPAAGTTRGEGSLLRRALPYFRSASSRSLPSWTHLINSRPPLPAGSIPPFSRAPRKASAASAKDCRALADFLAVDSDTGVARLGTPGQPGMFMELAQPYIRQALFGAETLLPGRGRQHSAPDQAAMYRQALEQALGVLSPYRIFTMSHLRHLTETDTTLRDAMAELGWSLEDFWIAIRETALLKRPLNEPWEQIHPAIRRLIHRYHFPASEARAEAHREARSFVAVWAENQPGTEQAIGLVECLWHEANSLSDAQPELMSDALTRSATILSAGLRSSPAYTADRSAALRGRTDDGGLRIARCVAESRRTLRATDCHHRTARRLLVTEEEMFPRYIPREEERFIQAEIARVRSDGWSRAVLVYGSGGIGKTSLLRKMAEASSDPDRRLGDPDRPDDPESWLLSDVERSIAQQIDPDNSYFELYQRYVTTLPRFTRPPGHTAVLSHLGRIKQVFLSCFQDYIESTGRTVVMVFNTVEAVRGMYLLFTLTQWMKAVPGTLFILSGRPPPYGQPDQIKAELEGPHQRMPLTIVLLREFTQASALAYLDRSGIGAALSADEKLKLVLLSRGHPLWLAFTVGYLHNEGLPQEAGAPLSGLERYLPYQQEMSRQGQERHESYIRRLVSPYQEADFWHEAVKRLAVIRQSVNWNIWHRLMADRPLPHLVTKMKCLVGALAPALDTVTCNGRYVTLHDAVADELAARIIPLHDQDMGWRQSLWHRAVAIYARVRPTNRRQHWLRSSKRPTSGCSAWTRRRESRHGRPMTRDAHRRGGGADSTKRELDQLKAAGFLPELCDFAAGCRGSCRCSSGPGRERHYASKICSWLEMQRFLPGGISISTLGELS